MNERTNDKKRHLPVRNIWKGRVVTITVIWTTTTTSSSSTTTKAVVVVVVVANCLHNSSVRIRQIKQEVEMFAHLIQFNIYLEELNIKLRLQVIRGQHCGHIVIQFGGSRFRQLLLCWRQSSIRPTNVSPFARDCWSQTDKILAHFLDYLYSINSLIIIKTKWSLEVVSCVSTCQLIMLQCRK